MSQILWKMLCVQTNSYLRGSLCPVLLQASFTECCSHYEGAVCSHHFQSTLCENKNLMTDYRLQEHCLTSEVEFGNSIKALITHDTKLELHWPLQVKCRLLHSLGYHWAICSSCRGQWKAAFSEGNRRATWAGKLNPRLCFYSSAFRLDFIFGHKFENEKEHKAVPP